MLCNMVMTDVMVIVLKSCDEKKKSFGVYNLCCLISRKNIALSRWGTLSHEYGHLFFLWVWVGLGMWGTLVDVGKQEDFFVHVMLLCGECGIIDSPKSS